MTKDKEKINEDQFTKSELIDNEPTNSNESNSEPTNSNESDNDDAPEEVDFSSTRKTAQQLAENQMNVLKRIKKQEQEKRKLNQDRYIEQKRLKIAKKMDQLNDEELSNESDNDKNLIKDIEKETQTSKLKIILNDSDQIDKINDRFIRKYRETNNRMISFKDRSIQTNSKIKRIHNDEVNRLLQKRMFK